MADGTITIDTAIDKKGLKVGIREVEESAKRATSSLEKNIGEKTRLAIQKQIDALSKLNNQYVQQAQKVDELKQKIKELSAQKVETESYKNLTKEMDSLYKKSAELESKLSEWSKMGVPERSLGFKEVEKELNSVILKMEEVERKQEEMRKSGTAYVNPENTQNYQSVSAKLTAEEQKLQDMGNRLETSYASIEQKIKSCGEAALKAGSKMETFAKATQKFSGKMITSGLDGIRRKIYEAAQATNNLVKRLLQISSNAIISGLKRISSGIFAIHKTANKSTFAIKDAIGNLFDGLEKGGTAGKIAAFLGKAFLTVKIAQITGLDSLIKLLIGAIGKKLFTSENIASIASSLKNLFSGGSKEAGELLGDLGEAAAGSGSKFGMLAKELAPLVGEAGLIVGVAAAAVYATSKIAGMVETMQGGNGMTTQYGGYLHDYATQLASVAKLTNNQSEELWKLIETDEELGKSHDEMYADMVSKLSEYGVSAEQARTALEQYGAQAGISADFVEGMTDKISALGDGISEAAGKFDTSKISVSDLKDTLYQLTLKSDEFGGVYKTAWDKISEVPYSNTTDALDAVYTCLKDAGVPLDELDKKLREDFPNAVQATKTSVDASMTGAQQTVTSTTSKMKTDAETNLAGVQKAAEDAAGGVNTSTVKNWGNSAAEVDKNLDQMKQTANLKLGEMQKTVDSHFTSQYNVMTKKWEKAGERISQIISSMETSTGRQFEKLESLMQSAGTRMGNNLANGVSKAATGITRTINEIIGKVNNTISNINGAVGGIERSFTFNYNYTNPVTKTAGKYSSWLSLPRVNSVPYLASGAVIPPRSEFMAVLGDQKSGNNLEAPEGLIRKIIREEVPQTQGGNTYNISAKAKGKTIFELILEEGKLSQDRTGKNPFLLV